MTPPAHEALRDALRRAPENLAYTEAGIEPLFQAPLTARICVVGQAPGIRAQTAGRPWADPSGDRLMDWMGIDQATFYSEHIAHVPMDFYYPGKGAHGDLPPRKDFAPTWHPPILHALPDLKLIICAGSYAQAYYLGPARKRTLTDTVRAFREYLPEHFPLVHPSPLNFRWHTKNPWFTTDVIPALRHEVHRALDTP